MEDIFEEYGDVVDVVIAKLEADDSIPDIWGELGFEPSVVENLDDVMNELVELLDEISLPEPGEYHEYDEAMSIVGNAIEARKRAHGYTRNGHLFTSMLHLSANSPETEDAVTRVYEDCKKKGLFYFQEAALDYDSETGSWTRVDAADDEGAEGARARVIIIDKLKVYTRTQYTVNVSKQYSMFGIEGTQDRSRQKNAVAPNMFLQEVCKSNNPTGTMVRYKRTAMENVPHGHGITEEPNINRLNVNMSRGFHDFACMMSMVAAHSNFINPTSMISMSLDPGCENNNSLTADSVINAVRNTFTFKKHAVEGETVFHLTSKTDFDTHKVVELYDDVDDKLAIGSYHKMKPVYFQSEEEKADWWECIKPLYGIEIQVHEHSMNCSAVPGSKLIPIICKKGAELLDDKNGDKIQVSLLVSNAKASIEKISQSLAWSPLMLFCDLMGWRMETHRMSREEEYRAYLEKCKPALDTIMASRDNYAQATSFCQQTVRSTRMYTSPEMKMISHKFKVPEIPALFSEINPERPCARKRKLDIKVEPGEVGEAPPVQTKRKQLVIKTARNESIIRLLEGGPRVFRQRFDLTLPGTEHF